MKVAIIGYGHVGKAMHKAFPDACIYDPAYEEFCDLASVNACDLAIVCAPTPSMPDGSCDVSAVEDCVSNLECDYILIKSAVPPGTTKKLCEEYGKNICVSPEYIGESKYWSPHNWSVLEEPFLVVGGEKHVTKYIIDLFKQTLGPYKKYFSTDSTTAEIVKYMENCFFATKVTFCNEFYEICKAFGADYNEVREMFVADPRVNPGHTLVFDDNRGFGGKCLPKDLNAIISASSNQGYEPRLLKQVLDSNNSFRSDSE